MVDAHRDSDGRPKPKIHCEVVEGYMIQEIIPVEAMISHVLEKVCGFESHLTSPRLIIILPMLKDSTIG